MTRYLIMLGDFPIMRKDAGSFEVLGLRQGDDHRYWLDRSAEERLAAIEELRQTMFGYDPVSERLQRVFDVAELKGG